MLVVGAGAVGQVYAHHLAQGGAEVWVWVRAKHAAAARAGYVLTRVSTFGGRKRARFVPSGVAIAGEAPELAAGFDQIWLTVPTTSLDDPALAELLRASGDATIVSLQPGQGVLEKLSALVAPERLVAGMIGMASWWAPMEGSQEQRERRAAEGVAYFFPPLGPTQLSGARAAAAVFALRRGGAPARRSPDVGPGQAFASATLMPLVAALESVGWSFARFRSTDAKALAASAALEAIEAAARASGSPPPLSRFALRPWLLGLGVSLARVFAPFDVEGFFRAHFLKVGAQTRLMLDQSIAEARAQGVEPSSLERLRRALD